MEDTEKGTEVSEEPKTPTEAEQLAQLTSQIETLSRERDEYKQGLSTAHSTITKKEQDLKRQADLSGEIDSLKGMMKILATAQAQGQAIADADLDDTERAKSPNVAKMWEDLEKQAEAKRLQAQRGAAEDAYQTQANTALLKVKELGFDKGTDEYEGIYDILEGGWSNLSPRAIERAERKIAKMSKPAETPRETEEQIYERVKAQKDKEKGLLATDTGSPSGTTKRLTIEQVRAMSPEERAVRSSEIAELPLALGAEK